MVWRRVGYKFVKASGPERLGAEWWRSGRRLELVPSEGHQKGLDVTTSVASEPKLPYAEGETSRDYYIAEDGGGRRFWLFRQGLHGFGAKIE